MKKFMERYSYECVRLFLNQIAIGLFGVSLAVASSMAHNVPLRIITGAFSVLFFLFLQYNVMWKVGANDRLSDDLGKMKVNYAVPLYLWLIANSLNFILALLVSLRIWFTNVEILGTVGAIAVAIKLIIEGMYTGLLAIRVGGAELNSYWFMHFLTPLPALAVVYIAYFLGSKNIKLTAPFSKDKKNK